jgi:hypothetical protein
MRKDTVPDEVEKLRHELHELRRASLVASRRGDYIQTGKLTAQAANLNRAIVQAQGLVAVGID